MTKIELQTAIENEALQVCALEAELAELSDAFGELWLKHRDFIDMNRDLIGLKWLNDEDKENRAVSVTTDEYREMLNAAEETTEADDFDTIIRRLDYSSTGD